MTTKPLNNNVLIEVQLDNAAVSRTDSNEDKQKGILIDFHVSKHHLTASSGYEIGHNNALDISATLKENIGKLVRWEQYAEGGQTFVEDGKTYALIPWWRLLSVTDNEETK